MGSTQERIQKRREYLKQKGWAYTQASLAGAFALLFAGVSYWLYGYCQNVLLGDTEALGGDTRLIPYALMVFLSLSLSCMVATLFLARSVHQSHQKAKQLPFVSPVTANTLPAEEVLVRGSEEPAQEQGKVLLRGTDSSGSMGEQELLRSSQGQE